MSAPAARLLYLDVQATQDPFNYERGIPRFVGMHAGALAEVPGAVSRLALSPFLGAPRSLPPQYHASPRLCWNTAAELGRARREGAIAYHLMSPLHVGPSLEASFPFAALGPEDALVVTMYDAVPLLEPREYLHTRSAQSSVRSRLDVVRSADLVLTLSRSSAAELVELLDLDPHQVACVGGGVDPFFSPARDGEVPARILDTALPDLRRRYVMSVTHHYERKNTELFLQGFGLLPAALRRDLQIVLVGTLEDAWTDRYRAAARAAGIDDEQLLLTGRVSDQALRALYQRADLFVAPSLSEGWGLPVAEAIACGCPAITSNTSALPEILEFPRSTFDPRDAAALAAVMEPALEDPVFRDELRAVGATRAREHRWPKVAQRTIDALTRLEDRDRRRLAARPRSPSPLRIAFAGRIDPDGIAEDRYNAELVGGLGAGAVVDVYVPDNALREPAKGAGATYLLGALGTTRNPHAYDIVVHSLGGAAQGQAQLEAAARAPGFVWLHDLDLVMPVPAPPNPAGELVAVEHRPRPNPTLMDAAHAVLVDWEADARLLRLARAALDLPVMALPLGAQTAPARKGSAPHRTVALFLGDAPDDTVVASWLDALQRPEARELDVRAALVGPTAALSSFAEREPVAVGTLPVIGLVPTDGHAALQDAFRSSRFVVDATADAGGSAMPARACLAAGRRLLTHRCKLAELGPSSVRVVDDGEDPRDVLVHELAAPHSPTASVSVDDVVRRLVGIVERWLSRTPAA